MIGMFIAESLLSACCICVLLVTLRQLAAALARGRQKRHLVTVLQVNVQLCCQHRLCLS
jgi:hypothetical protein